MRHNVAKVSTFNLYPMEVVMERHHVVEKEIEQLVKMGILPEKEGVKKSEPKEDEETKVSYHEFWDTTPVIESSGMEYVS